MPLLHKGDVLGDDSRRYLVQRKLGEGQFAEVWEVRLCDGASCAPTHERYALKLEKRKDRNTVKQEYKALKKLSGVCDQVAAVEGFGVHDERFFMVLQLAGETLFDARKQRGGRLSAGAVKAVGLSTLAAIQQVHEAHLIHRDIKPANFVLNPPNAAADKGVWLLIDFGLARRFTDEDGAHLPPRPGASFRGSTTYASVHAHRGEDLSRRDDLWSWLYMLAELLDGGLPWRLDKEGGEHTATDKGWVQQQKEACMDTPALLMRTVALPEPLAAISSHLRQLAFEAAPDYALLRGCLQQLPDDDAVVLTDLSQPPQHQQQALLHGQAWAAAANGQAHAPGQQQQQQQQQQPQQPQPGLNGHPLQQLPHQEELLTPASPPQEQQMRASMEPVLAPPPAPPPAPAAAAAAAGAAAATNKRPRPDAPGGGAGAAPAADAEQAAKRRRPDTGQGGKTGGAQQQPSQQQQQQQGSNTRHGPPEPAAAGKQADQDGAKASAAGGGGIGAASRVPRRGDRPAGSDSRSRERAAAPPQQQQQRSEGRQPERDGSGNSARAPAARPASNSRQCATPAGPARERPAPRDAAGSSGRAGTAAAAAAASGGGGGGRAREIGDLLAAFSASAPAGAKSGVRQAVAGLCALPPLEAVAAIGLTLDKLAAQCEHSCGPAAAQLLLDLSAFAAAGAARLQRGGGGKQQQ